MKIRWQKMAPKIENENKAAKMAPIEITSQMEVFQKQSPDTVFS